MSVIEFRKRELVHAHIILLLDEESKFALKDPHNIDYLISSEIPPITSPHLRQLVLKYMIHSSCEKNPTARCIREGKCSKKFPKQFFSETSSAEGDYCVRYTKKSPRDGGEFEV